MSILVRAGNRVSPKNRGKFGRNWGAVCWGSCRTLAAWEQQRYCKQKPARTRACFSEVARIGTAPSFLAGEFRRYIGELGSCRVSMAKCKLCGNGRVEEAGTVRSACEVIKIRRLICSYPASLEGRPATESGVNTAGIIGRHRRNTQRECARSSHSRLPWFS